MITLHVQVCKGIILANGETAVSTDVLKSLGVTHLLNAAEGHVQVSPTKLAVVGIQYHGFHVDDLPESNISRFVIDIIMIKKSSINFSDISSAPQTSSTQQ